MVVLLAALLLLGCSSCSTAAHGGAVGHPDGATGPALLSRSELVMVLPSSDSRMVLIEASRPWRLGIRTYVPTNATHPAVKALNRHEDSRRHLETYVHMPDEVYNRSSKLKPLSRRPGDHRAALAPFLAHRHFGSTYKWMLYGDDDTLFYVPAVLQLLRGMDHTQPVAISDNLWLQQDHPSPGAPRCLPCSTGDFVQQQQQVQQDGKLDAAAASSSTRRRLGSSGSGGSSNRNDGSGSDSSSGSGGSSNRSDGSGSDSSSGSSGGGGSSSRSDGSSSSSDDNGGSRSIGVPPSGRPRFDPRAHNLFIPVAACHRCMPHDACAPIVSRGMRCHPAGAHGGAGVIMSVGLLQALPLDKMQRCFLRNRGASGGDRLLSACLHHFNVSFTDPGLWLHAVQSLSSMGSTSSTSAATADSDAPSSSNNGSGDGGRAAGGQEAGEAARRLQRGRAEGGEEQGEGEEEEEAPPSPEAVFGRHVLFDNKMFRKLLQDPWKYLRRGDCDAHCCWLLRHAVSLHIGSRIWPSLQQAAQALHGSATSHARALALIANYTSAYDNAHHSLRACF